MSALSAFLHLSSEPVILYALDLNSECTFDCVSLFLDMFDSMPEQSPTTESKAATTPSVDLFGAGTGVDMHFSVCGTSSSPISFFSFGFRFFFLLLLLFQLLILTHVLVFPPLWYENCA